MRKKYQKFEIAYFSQYRYIKGWQAGSLCSRIGYKWVTVMDSVKFEFNDVITMYKKNDFERRRSGSQ